MALDIPKLQRNVPITKNDLPADSFHIWWQNVANSLKAAIDLLQQQVADIQAAMTAATEAKRNTARINSYTLPTNVLHGVDAGSDAKITIDAHTRVYPDDGELVVPDVSIGATELTGLAYSTQYYVYYDDPTLSDTTPAFQTTIVPSDAQVGAGPARHFVGVVMTPSSGGGSTGGGGGTPPGGGGGPIP